MQSGMQLDGGGEALGRVPGAILQVDVAASKPDFPTQHIGCTPTTQTNPSMGWVLGTRANTSVVNRATCFKRAVATPTVAVAIFDQHHATVASAQDHCPARASAADLKTFNTKPSEH